MLSLSRLVLCLLLWIPAAAYAQSPDVQTSPPPEEEESNLLVPRLLVGPTVGGVAGAAGGIVGLLAGLVIGDCNVLDGCSSDLLAITPVVLGLWSASAFTVYGMGRVLDGRGALLPTLLGGALGSGAGILIGVASDALYVTPLIAALGAAIGFELSHAGTKPVPERDPFAAAGLQLTPVVSMTPAGGVFGGLVGRF